MRAEWGDTALTAANCAKAKVAAIGWGARCTNDACTTAEWQKIGGPKQKTGTWNATSNTCDTLIQFNSSDKKFKTLNIDIIATLPEGVHTVRKRAKGFIYVSHPNGKCLSPQRQARKKRDAMREAGRPTKSARDASQCVNRLPLDGQFDVLNGQPRTTGLQACF